jgi:dsDNA-specific endonuclease/ATPase MutS2
MANTGLLSRLLQWFRGPEPRPPADEPDDEPIDSVELAIEDHFDLHTFAPRDVVAAAEAYLDEARRLGFREVRLIHGRGKGVQRAAVRRMLSQRPDVLSFADAPAHRGGWGATVVELSPMEPGP